LAIVVILILAVLWAAVLLPPILRSRNESGARRGRGGIVGDFMARLGSLGRSPHHGDAGLPALHPIAAPLDGTGPSGPGGPIGPVRVPGQMTPSQRRRRDVLVGLLAAVVLTFLMAVFAGNVAFWVINGVADVLLVGYLYLLVEFRARNMERRTKVAPIDRRPQVPAGTPLGPVTANGHPETHVEPPAEAQVLVLRRTGSY
jgi:hypothetical protein